MTSCRISIGMVTVAFCALLAGCGAPTEENASTAMPRLMSDIEKNLPKGWKIGFAKDSGVDFASRAKPEDILVWKTEKTLLRQRGTAASEDTAAPRTPAQLLFAMKLCPFIEPTEYPDVYKANNEIKKQYDYWNKTVSNMPRDANGRPAPRGDEEAGAANRYNQAYPKLPPYNADLPTHYYEVLAVKLWDSRPVLEPEDRLLQQEMNATYFAITKPLKQYRSHPPSPQK